MIDRVQSACCEHWLSHHCTSVLICDWTASIWILVYTSEKRCLLRSYYTHFRVSCIAELHFYLRYAWSNCVSTSLIWDLIISLAVLVFLIKRRACQYHWLMTQMTRRLKFFTNRLYWDNFLIFCFIQINQLTHSIKQSFLLWLTRW